MNTTPRGGGISRRRLLAGLAGAGVLIGAAGCSRTSANPVVTGSGSAAPTGPARSFAITARPVKVDLAGRQVSTWAYGDSIPGRPIRVTAGDRVRVEFTNKLPTETSIHWHGLAIRNDMDGVPGVTTPAIPADGTFTYDFVVPDPGTHWFHPHTGLQLDRGLYAPFIVDDPHDPGDYDREWIVVLDDWTDGVGPDPDTIFADLVAAGDASGDGGMDMGDMGGMGGMDGMSGHGSSGGMGMFGGDVAYPLYLINGRPVDDPETLRAKPGDRVRLRIINAAADTVFTVALADHDLTITHSDGYPVQAIPTSSVRIGMGERYDAIVTVKDGAFALVAQPDGKNGVARAVLRSSRSTTAPPATDRPAGLSGYALTADALQCDPRVALPAREPDSEQHLALSGTMSPYVWTINGRTYEDTEPLTIAAGQAGRLAISNHSMMAHPLHLHGHTFQVGTAGGSGARKDTLLIPPMGTARVDFAADNPGTWMIHCHNAYHAEAGMMTRLEYA